MLSKNDVCIQENKLSRRLSNNYSMLLVFSELPAERERLEEEFKRAGSYYAIPSQQAYALAQLIASITYEYCHDHPPHLLVQIEKLITSAMNNTYSLSLYRQIVQTITHQCRSLEMYRQHLHEMNQAFALDDGYLAIEHSLLDSQDRAFGFVRGEDDKQGSREIDSFRKRGNGIIESNNNLKTLMIEELRSDVNRELILSRTQKNKYIQQFRYNKKMREMLLVSKLRSRKKL